MNDAERRALFQRLVRDQAGELYRFALLQTGQAEQAEDLVQETYYEAWRSIARLREPEKARAWLFQILRHRFAHWVRAKSRRPQATVDVTEQEIVSKNAVDALESLERRDAIRRALQRLDERYRETFLLVFLEGFSCREAAAFLEIPLGTVLSRIHRARRDLRASLSEFETVQNRESGSPALKIVRKEEPHG